MSGSTDSSAVFGDRTDEAGFPMLGLAQLVTVFALWMGIWPGAFGTPRSRSWR